MIHTFIRAFRKQNKISQQELADLLGLSRAVIDRTETGDARPTLDLAFRLQVAFGVPPATLFPETFSRIEERVMRTAKGRYDALEGKTDKRSASLREFYEAMARRSLVQGASHPGA